MKLRNYVIALGITMLASTSTKAADTPQSSTGDGYTMVWSDEFDGSVLNNKMWNIEVNGNGGGNQELQYYRSDNIAVANGSLVITAKKENYGGKEFTSGRINSMGKVAFKHGKIEARIKLPKTANGLWPAFWLMGNDMNTGTTWPYCGEIDVLESGNAEGINAGTQEKYFNGALHWGPYTNGNHPMYAKGYEAPYSVQDGEYHLWTLVWDENQINMYLDLDKNPGENAYFTMNISDKSADNSPGNYFHKQFFILFNMAVGGSVPNIFNAGGITALNNGDQKMYVDYVRVYQRTGEEDYTTPDNSTDNPPVEDTSTALGSFGSLALDANHVSTFDFKNANDYVIISASDGVKNAMAGKIKADYNVDDVNNFLYIWNDTYAPQPWDGSDNSFGFTEAYNHFTVGNIGWSGLGYASVKGTKGKDLSMINDDYFVHFAMRGLDAASHKPQGIRIGNASFSVGKSAFVDNGTTMPLLGDYKRDGRWCYFDIPVSILKQLAGGNLFSETDGGPTAYTGNAFAVLSGGGAGTDLQFDNVFFYRNPTKSTDMPTGDTTTQLGKYGYAALNEKGTTNFDFNNAEDFVIIGCSNGVRDAMSGKIKADYSIDDTNNFLYVWNNTYNPVDWDGTNNSFGFAEAYNHFTVGNVGWSGLGYASKNKGKDLSMLDNTYYLHFSMKGNDALYHTSQTVGIGTTSFVIGNAGSPIIGDYKRDGNWYSFDIPYSLIASLSGGNPFPDKDGGSKAYMENVFSILSGGTQGSELQFDNVFFFKKINDNQVTTQYVTKSIDSNGASTFDFNHSTNYVLIDVTDNLKTQMGTNVLKDYRVDDVNNFLYVWENTYNATSTTGVNSFGEASPYRSFTVAGNPAWSGLGYISENVGKDLSMIDDSYFLHFAMKGTGAENYAIEIGNAKFTIGSAPFNDNGTTIPVLCNYTRDGEWYNIDIPVSDLKLFAPSLFNNAGNCLENVFVALSGGTAGTKLQYDGIFFYKKVSTGLNDMNAQNNDKAEQLFDISGRKVQNMNQPGLYIVKTSKGAKKVLVK